MNFSAPLLKGTLIRRYKRFLADIRLPDGTLVTAHTSNTGAMTGCNVPGSRVWLSQSGNPRRKYPLSWELVECAGKTLVGINTTLANRLVREGIERGVIAELQGYDGLRTEAVYGEENSRVDLLLESKDGSRCFVEVKNVTLVENGVALFPDAVSSRGTKHLRELAAMVRQGQRGVIFFCVQRQDARMVCPADAIDTLYGQTLRQVMAQGVEALAYDCHIGTSAIELRGALPVHCPALP